jgi:hypothetical protein
MKQQLFYFHHAPHCLLFREGQEPGRRISKQYDTQLSTSHFPLSTFNSQFSSQAKSSKSSSDKDD